MPIGRPPFVLGEEMQHDTSPHVAHLAGAERRVQTASLVLCHSRLLFFQLYLRFTRFECRVFLTDALQYVGGACADCMIDNTHVVVLHGTGKTMVPVPEMEAFARRLGFRFVAHEKGHANRSAHVERQFHHIEHNFYPGRQFADFADANRQARAWCDKVNATFKKHLHAQPRELFAVEQPALRPLPAWIPEVYALHQRIVDVEGYIHVDGHVYSVPYQLIGRPVEVRETKDTIRVFVGPRQVAIHARAEALGAKQRATLAAHRPPRGQVAAHLHRSPDELDLAAAGELIAAYAVTLKQKAPRWPVALRRLAQMRRDYPAAPFLAALEAATHYGLYDLDRVERIVLRNIATAYFVLPVERPSLTMKDDLAQLLKNLRLGKVAELFDDEIKRADGEKLSHQELWCRLLRAQWQANQEGALAWRIKRAGLPDQWTLESFPFKRQPGVNQRQIRTFAELEFVPKAENLVFVGPTGVGKTGLASGLLLKALQNGYRGIFMRAQDLFDEMYASLADRSTRRLLNRLTKVDVLVIDEMGYLNLRPEQTNIFFKLMEERYRQRPTIITTNLDYAEWATFLGNKALVEALLSRLRHQCTTIKIDGPSLRDARG